MNISLKDGSKIELPDQSSAKELAETLNLKGPSQALAVIINGKTCDLTTPLKSGDSIEFLSFEDTAGKEVFWHTSAHVLAQAILRLWPKAKPTIGPPIENGFYYDFADLEISEDDFPKIEKEIKAILKDNYVSERTKFKNKEEAIEYFKENPYKIELINSFDPSDELTGYTQGEFFDLCRGPHLPRLGKIKAFKILKTSGAYWRGDSQNTMLTRIYGISYPDRDQLKEYLHMLEEAKKRDHRVLGNQLDLFSMKEVAAGMPFIHPKGTIIWNALTDYLRELLAKGDYVEIRTPALMSRELWERSGHWENYRENMFTSEIENHDFAIKPMNCPGCMLYYKGKTHSYRDLPYRVSEIGNVHRYEPSGALSGLFRVRSFHQDDAHVFMKPEDIEDEVIAILNFADELYKTFGLNYHLELSTRPEKNTIGSDEEWEMATQGLKNALDKWGHTYKINEGDGAFYGPKIDFHIRDAIGRTWQCGTVQLDNALPRRFELEYTANDGSRQRPVMLHRAIFGSIERFFGILIEHFAGKFPLWLSPEQIRILNVADRHLPYGEMLHKKFTDAGFHCTLDKANESISKKVRNAQLQKINYILTIGDKEMENGSVNVRTRDNIVHGEMEIDPFISILQKEKSSRSLTSGI